MIQRCELDGLPFGLLLMIAQPYAVPVSAAISQPPLQPIAPFVCRARRLLLSPRPPRTVHDCRTSGTWGPKDAGRVGRITELRPGSATSRSRRFREPPCGQLQGRCGGSGRVPPATLHTSRPSNVPGPLHQPAPSSGRTPLGGPSAGRVRVPPEPSKRRAECPRISAGAFIAPTSYSV